MCSVPRPYFWDAIRVQKKDKVLVLEMDCSGVQLLDLSRGSRTSSLKWDIHTSKISYVQVLNSTVEPADETCSCALVFFDYRLVMEQLQKVNVLGRVGTSEISASEVFDKTVRWIPDTRQVTSRGCFHVLGARLFLWLWLYEQVGQHRLCHPVR